MRLLPLCAGVLLAAAESLAGEPAERAAAPAPEERGAAVEVELVEGGPFSGGIVAVDPGRSFRIWTEGKERLVPVADIVRLTPQKPAAQLPGEGTAGIEAILVLRTGETLKGRLVVATAEELAVRTESLGRFTVPLASVAGVVLGEGTKNREIAREIARAGGGGKDRVRTASGDRIEGMIEAFTNDGLRFSSDLGKIPYRFEALHAVAFAALGEAPKLPARPYCRVRLAEGGLACDAARVEKDGTLRLAAFAGFECAVPLGAVKELTVRNGRLVHLSELEPARVETRSFVEGLPFLWEVRRDANVLGRPMRLGKRAYARGLGVHSYTRLAYALDGGYARFGALVGLDDEAAGHAARAQVRVLLDGETAFEAVLARGEAPRRVDLDLADKKELVLLTDFGPDDADQGDAVNWADARLIKKK